MTLRVGFIIIARMKSERLPRKALLEVAGRPLLAHMHDRISQARRVDKVVLATSTLEDDDPIAELADREGICCFRGHPDDVLQRLYDASVAHGLDYILHVPGDSPFADPGYCDRTVEAFERSSADLITTLDLPRGSFIYGLNPAALARAIEIKDDIRTEVWGRYFTHTDLFEVERLEVDPLHNRPEVRVTLDYPEDFRVIERLYEALHRPGQIFSLDQLIEFLDTHPEVAEINAHCEAMYQRRWLGQADIRLKERHHVSSAAVIGATSISLPELSALHCLGIDRISAWHPPGGGYDQHGSAPCIDTAGSPGTINTFDTVQEMLAHAPEVAIINGPIDDHADAFDQVLSQVRGIFVMAPFLETLNGAQALMERLRERRVTTFVGYRLQHHPMVLEINRQLASGRFGDPISFRAAAGSRLTLLPPAAEGPAPSQDRTAGASSAFAMIEEIRMACAWLGEPIAVVSDPGRQDSPRLTGQSSADLTICHAEARASQLHLDLGQRPRRRRGVLSCERGFLRYDLEEQVLEGCTDGDEAPRVLWNEPGLDAIGLAKAMYGTFLRYAREGRVHHEHDAWQGLRATAVIEAGTQSSQSNRWARVPAWVRDDE